jgi:hypothetical protein
VATHAILDIGLLILFMANSSNGDTIVAFETIMICGLIATRARLPAALFWIALVVGLGGSWARQTVGA